ncbi:hypothetical protein HanIR_Chr11g0559471 [Helianthus annuus]|nr:hypothetical protein HanIR_Chr11g0559471 [Helianthus annuus]
MMNNGLRSCVWDEIGLLSNVTSISGLVSVEQFSNYLSGSIPESVCRLPPLERESERNFFS